VIPEKTRRFEQITNSDDYGQKNSKAEQFCHLLTQGDVEELVFLLRSGTVPERDAAIRVLANFIEVAKRDLSDEVKREWVMALKEIVKEHYPLRVLGQLAFINLLQNDRGAAERFLIEGLSLADLGEDELKTVARDLCSLRSNVHAVERLKEIAKNPGEAGTLAKGLLERHVRITDEQVQELAKAWREARSSEALSKLYYRYITKLRVGETRLSDLTALLGPPTGKDQKAVWYVASPGTALYLEKDEDGKLVAFRLS
jgi:hypothetical protein